jgi:hypothetical protein
MVSVKIDFPNEAKLRATIENAIRQRVESVRCPIHRERAKFDGSHISGCCDKLVQEVRKTFSR